MALSKSNVNENSGGGGLSHGVDMVVQMMATRFGGHVDWRVKGGHCSGLGVASWWRGVVLVDSSGRRQVEEGNVGWHSWGGCRALLSLGWFDSAKYNDLPKISFTCLSPFKWGRGGGSPSGMSHEDRRSCWFWFGFHWGVDDEVPWGGMLG